MRTHSANFKEEIKNAGRVIDSVITCSDDTIINASKLKSVKPILNAELFRTVMKGLNFETTEELQIGLNVHYEFKLWINDTNEFETLDYGNYIIYDRELNEDTGLWSYKCYDNMVLTTIDYEPLNVTYPITLRNYLIAFASHFGWNFKNANETFPNYDKEIAKDLWYSVNQEGNPESLGYTYRDVLDDFAGAVAGNIIINNDDELEIKYFNNTYDTIDKHYLKDVNVKFKDKVGPFNAILLTRSADSNTIRYPNPYPANANPLVIRDNNIMNYLDRETYLPDIFEVINGLEYYVNDYISTGVLYYEFGDMYNVEIDNNTYNCIMFNDEPIIKGGIVENIFTPMLEENTITKADDTDKKFAQVYLLVDQTKQTITGHINDVEGNVNELTLTVNGLELDVKKHGDNILMGTDLYDLSKWGYRQVYYYEAPEPSEQGYWYCTRTSGQYLNGVIYHYENGVWNYTDLKRKDLEGDKINYDVKIVQTSEIMNKTICQRALSLGSTLTENYLIDRTKGHLTFSSKLKNELKNGDFGIYIHQQVGDYESLNGKTISETYYEGPKTNDFENLNFTIPIFTNESVVTGYMGSTEPNDYDYWLDTTDAELFILKLKTINSETEEVTWTIVSDKVFKNGNTYYTPNVFILEDMTIVKYEENELKNFDTNFVTIELGVSLNQSETTQDGDVLISDIKLEYGQTATDWTNNYNEVYGKNYRLDDKGFKISKADNELFLDEDELTGKYKGDTMFQINGDRVFSKNGVFETTNQNGLITKKLSNGMYVRYIE